MSLEVVRAQRNTLGRQIGQRRHEASAVCAQSPSHQTRVANLGKAHANLPTSYPTHRKQRGGQKLHHTGEGRCPSRKWVLAFPTEQVRGLKARGNARERRGIESSEGIRALAALSQLKSPWPGDVSPQQANDRTGLPTPPAVTRPLIWRGARPSRALSRIPRRRSGGCRRFRRTCVSRRRISRQSPDPA
jgi:hypothetical protein